LGDLEIAAHLNRPPFHDVPVGDVGRVRHEAQQLLLAGFGHGEGSVGVKSRVDFAWVVGSAQNEGCWLARNKFAHRKLVKKGRERVRERGRARNGYYIDN